MCKDEAYGCGEVEIREGRRLEAKKKTQSTTDRYK